MKLSLLAIISLTTALIFPGWVRADDHEAIVKALAEKRNEHVVEVMTSGLNLSPDQQTTVKATLDMQTQQLMDLQKELADKQKSIYDQAEAQIMLTLTAAQKDKYPDVKAQLQKEAAQGNRPLNINGTGKSDGDSGSSGGMSHRGGGRHGGMGGGY